MSVALSEVCELVKGGLDPQRHAGTTFAHYSIPAFDSGHGPAIEFGAQIHSQKTPIPRGVVLVSKLNPRIPRVWHIDDDQPHQRICSTEFVPLQPDPKRLAPEYLGFALREALQAGYIKGNTAAATKSRERAKPTDFLRIKIKLPLIAEQRRVVNLLSLAENIVRMRREAEAKAKEIIPALFLDMFGDPARNERGWEVAELRDVSDIQGGLQVTTKRSSLPLEVPYLRVANVHRTHLDLSEIKTIRVTPPELERTRLREGDLLVVEGHGNPAEVGRVGIWAGAIEPCTHQNHLIRVRCAPARLDPSYVWAALNSQGGRHSLLRQGKTTSGLNTISVANVMSVHMLVPPIQLQRDFAERVGRINGLEGQQTIATAQAESAFRSLLHGVFGEGA